MYKVSQYQKERLRKDGRGQYLDALLLSAKGGRNKDGLQQDTLWYQLIYLGTSFCFTYSQVNLLGSAKGRFHGRPRHRRDVSQLYVKQ